MIADLARFRRDGLAVRKIDFLWPSAILLIAVLVAWVIGLSLITRQIDEVSRAREQEQVAHGLAQRILEVQQMVVPQVVWDDAVRHLDQHLDPIWAAANLGKYLSQTDGFDAIYVLDAHQRPVFAFEDGASAPISRYAPLESAALPLVRIVRRGERARGVLDAPHLAVRVGRPIQASAMVRREQGLWIVTATLVQPDFGTVLPTTQAPVVVTAMQVDAAFLASFARRYLLADLRLDVSAAAASLRPAHILIATGRDAVPSTLSWQPQAIGRTLLRRLVLPSLILFGALIVTAVLLMRRNQRLAERLITGEAHTVHLAHHDPLTGLPNRLSLFVHLAKCIAALDPEREPLAVYCIDLDRFKEVNDCYGHQVGDQLIKLAARRLAAVCGSDALLAHLSGDEFAVVHPPLSQEAAAAFAARLAQSLADPISLASGRVFSSCSIGIALVKGPDTDGVEAMRRADLALYRAKDAGRNCWRFFDTAMDNALRSRRALETDLRDAVAAGMLSMVYQPQVDRHGDMTGVEALMRWEHPLLGDIPPTTFIPLAEESGLIGDIGMLAFRRVFADSTAWRGLKVAINVSACQLRMHGFVSDLRAVVHEFDVDPRHFELEITESVLLGDNPAIQSTLAELHVLGFSLALDDFGTGYSSLSYLRKYPIDKIKIDRSFVLGLGVDDEAEAVIGAIVKLARALKLAVIAEGVETDDQRARLATVGCSHIQGFLYSRPVAPSVVRSMIASGIEWHARKAA